MNDRPTLTFHRVGPMSYEVRADGTAIGYVTRERDGAWTARDWHQRVVVDRYPGSRQVAARVLSERVKPHAWQYNAEGDYHVCTRCAAATADPNGRADDCEGGATFDLWYVHPATGARSVAFTGSAIDVGRQLAALLGCANDDELAAGLAGDLLAGSIFEAQHYVAARTGSQLPR